MRYYLEKIDRRTTARRCDVTPVFSDVKAFDALVNDLAAVHKNREPNVVACLDALGFILGTAIARALRVGVVPIRKGGKLPVHAFCENLLDYSGGGLRITQRAMLKGADEPKDCDATPYHHAFRRLRFIWVLPESTGTVGEPRHPGPGP